MTSRPGFRRQAALLLSIAISCTLLSASACRKGEPAATREGDPAAAAAPAPPKINASAVPAAGSPVAAKVTLRIGAGSGLLNPRSVAIDKTGNIFVADTGHGRIVKFDPTGRELLRFGQKGKSPGDFSEPWTIGVSQQGNVLVHERESQFVQCFTPDGKYVSRFGGTGPGLYFSGGMAVTADGTPLVADTGNNRVQRFNSQGGFIGQFGNFGWSDGFLNAPVGLALGPDNTVYITDMGNNRIQRFNTGGSFMSATESFPLACGISVDGSGAVYFLDVKEMKLGVFSKIDRRPEYLKGEYDVKVYESSQIALDAVGKKVYLWDPGERKIHILYGE